MRFYFLILLALLSTPALAGHPCAVGEKIEGSVFPTQNTFDFRLQGRAETFVLAGMSVIRQTWNGGKLTLYATETKPDRYGRVRVYAFDDEGWVQRRYLEKGAAFVDGKQKGGPCLDALWQAERVGEQKGLGVWMLDDLHVDADELTKLNDKVGYWRLVTGEVLSVGDRERRLYLNFGQNWRQDFTVVVVKKGAGAFNGNIEALTELAGKTVRVRGPIEENQGPLIRLFHETQLEILK